MYSNARGGKNGAGRVDVENNNPTAWGVRGAKSERVTEGLTSQSACSYEPFLFLFRFSVSIRGVRRATKGVVGNETF